MAVDNPGVFSRKASGLLRVAGAWDTFIFNIGLVSVGIAIALNQYYGPSLYPGAAIWLSTLIAGLGMLFVAGTFYFWSVIFPRSGGIYVSLSRTVSPALAFVLTLVETLILLYYGAFATSLLVSVGISSFFGTVGAIAHGPALIAFSRDVAAPNGMFICGTIILLLAGGLLASGSRNYFFVQKVVFVVALVGTAVTILVLLFGSRATFIANFEALSGLKYDQVIATAKSHGWMPADMSWGPTVGFLVFPLLPLLGAVQSVGIGGEIKRVNRSQMLGMFGAVIASAVVIALTAVLADKAFGSDFQGAIAFNSLSKIDGGSIEATVGASPWFTVLAGMLTDSVLLAAVIMAGFIAWIWFWIPAELAYTTRTMIAWSFDRIAPEGLGYVSDRFHTPVVAIGASTAAAIVFMALIAYANIQLLTLVEVLLVVWGAAMVCAVIFPFTQPSLFSTSPVSRSRIIGLPLVSVTGLIATLFFAYTIYLLWNDPNAAGPLIAPGKITLEFWIVLGTVVFGVLWYLFIRSYRRRQGIDIDLAFKQIPIE